MSNRNKITKSNNSSSKVFCIIARNIKWKKYLTTVDKSPLPTSSPATYDITFEPPIPRAGAASVSATIDNANVKFEALQIFKQINGKQSLMLRG